MPAGRRAFHSQSRGRFIAGLCFCLLSCMLTVFLDLRLKDALFSDRNLPVRAVVIDGALMRIDKKEVAALAGRLCAGRNLAALDLHILRQALLQLPWVARAQVKKQMPDRLVISLIEHVPAAYWNENGLYDARARQVFYPDLSRFSEPLVRLRAPHDSLAPEVYTKAVLFMRELKRADLQMSEVLLDNIRCFRIKLLNGTTLILGRDNDGQIALARLKRFLAAIRGSGFDLQAAEYVDLRYDIGFAVKERAKEQQ